MSMLGGQPEDAQRLYRDAEAVFVWLPCHGACRCADPRPEPRIVVRKRCARVSSRVLIAPQVACLGGRRPGKELAAASRRWRGVSAVGRLVLTALRAVAAPGSLLDANGPKRRYAETQIAFTCASATPRDT